MTTHGRTARGGLIVALVLALTAPLRAEPITIVTLGDSLTDTYQGKPYAGNNLSWTDQLVARRAAQLNITNLARAGSTSVDMIVKQQPVAVDLIKQGTVRFATVMIGANDVAAFLAGIDPANPATFNPTPYVQMLANNVSFTVDALWKAGATGIVLTNVPDIGHTPILQSMLGSFPAILQLLTATTDAMNAEIDAIAQSRNLPVVDLHALNEISDGPVSVGGVDVQPYLYSVDGFHPSTIGAGLLANAEIEALRRAYNLNLTPLSDSEILTQFGLTAQDSSATFDVSRFVILAHTAPEPSSLLLVTIGAIGMLGAVRRRRRARSTIVP